MTIEGAPAPEVAEVLVSSAAIQRRVIELAGELDATYRGSGSPLLLVGILNGSLPFLSDLVRRLTLDVEVDFMAISAYGGGVGQSGVVRIVKDLDEDIGDRDVVIVEDIVDTGLTLNYLRRALMDRSPRSLAALALLDKTARRIVPVSLEQRGFEVPDVFVVGYGLDFQGLYRNVPDVYGIKDVARLAAEPRLLLETLYRPPQA